MVRRACAVLLVVVLTACGDERAPAPQQDPGRAGTPAEDPPAAPPRRPGLPDGPVEAVLDDEHVLAAVVATATTRAPLPDALAVLPPRVSPVRVGVRAIHDHLLGARDAAQSWDGLVAALGSLSALRSSTDPGALGPLVEAWRGWTKEDREAESALALRTTRALDLLQAPGPIDVGGLARLLTAPPKAPAKSPAAATLEALRAAHLALAAKDASADAAIDEALRAARTRFDALGWPGGAGVVLDFAGGALARGADDASRLRSILVANHAMEAYRASKDKVRVAQVLLDLAAGARRTGEIARAENLARTAEEALTECGARGSEVVDATFFRAWTLQALGRHGECLAAHDRILREIEAMRLDPAQRAPVLERKASSLFVLGRYEEALAAADAGAAAYDAHVRAEDPERERLRAGIDELAGECLVELGRTKEGAARHLLAAARHERLADGRRAASVDRMLAARALGRGGDREGAVALVRQVLGEPVLLPAVRAQAASVLRDAGAVAEARTELDRAIAEGGPGLAAALVEEQARLEAAAGRRDEARRLFAEAETTATRGSGRDPAGPQAARVLLDWARMEDAAGDPDRARELADRALHHLAGGGLPMEADRAQALVVSANRRLLAFGDAERVTLARLKQGVPGPPARLDDAILDLFLVRLERAGAGGDDAARKLAEVLGELPQGAVRDVAAALAHPGVAAVPPDVESLSPRLRTLREAASLHDADPAELLAFARRAPTGEPEIRRWALARAVTPRDGVGARRIDPCEWTDLRRGAEPVTEAKLRAVLAADEAFVLIEPVGAWTHVVWMTGASGGDRNIPGDLALPRLWDAVHVERTAAAVQTAGAEVLAAGLRETLVAARAAGARRLTISIASPLGPLPLEALPWGEGTQTGTIADAFDVAVVASASERVAAAARPEGDAPPAVLRSPVAPLAARRALVAAAPTDAAAEQRFSEALRAALAKGLAVPLAVRTAKETLRAAGAAGPAQPSGVPLWATYVLRGAW